MYETLTKNGVEVPKYVVLNRPDGTGECDSHVTVMYQSCDAATDPTVSLDPTD